MPSFVKSHVFYTKSCFVQSFIYLIQWTCFHTYFWVKSKLLLSLFCDYQLMYIRVKMAKLNWSVHFVYLIFNVVADPGEQETEGRGAETKGSVRGQRAGRWQGPREHRGVLQTVPPVPGPPQRGRVSVKSQLTLEGRVGVKNQPHYMEAG